MTAENSRPQRLGRLDAIFVESPIYFVTACTNDDEKIALANWMKSMKNSLSKTLRSRKVPVPHWQKTFFDHVLRSSESYSEKWEYVCENPVRAGLVQRADDWPFQGEIFSL